MSRWPTKLLSDICTFSNGLWTGKKGPLTKASVFRNTNIRPHGVLDAGNVANLEVEQRQLEKRRLESGDIIIEKSGGGPKQAVGRVAYFDKADGVYSFSNFTSAARVRDRSEIEPRYLLKFLDWCYVRGITERMQSNSTGIRNLDFGAYKAIEVPLPPLEEQRRIVAVLDEAFVAVAIATENAAKNLANARELFECEIDRRVGWQQWSTALLESFTDHITDGDHQPPPKASSGVPFITISNIHKALHRIEFSNTFLVSREYYEALSYKRQPRRGDILYTVAGSFGIPVVVEEEREFCFQRHVGLIRPKPDVDSTWLYYVLRSKTAQRQADAAATGTAQRTVGLKALRNFSVPMIPRDEQERIVRQLTRLRLEVECLSRRYTRQLELAGTLRQALLHRAFSGELTKREPLTA